MNNIFGKELSDTDSLKTVDYFNSIGKSAKTATVSEDRHNKFDIVIGGQKIDLKRFSHFYCEIEKLQLPNNKADKIWMIVDGDIHRSCLIDKNALIRICAKTLFDPNDIDSSPMMNHGKHPDINYWIGPWSGQLLADFNINMLKPTDYQIIDMFWLN